MTWARLQHLLQEGEAQAEQSSPLGATSSWSCYRREFSPSPPLLLLPEDSQPISNCNFLLLTKKKFQHLSHLFLISFSSILILPGWGLLSLRIKPPVSFLFRKMLSISRGSSQTHHMLSGKILFSSSLAQHPTIVVQKAGKVSVDQMFSAPGSSPIRRVISLNLIPFLHFRNLLTLSSSWCLTQIFFFFFFNFWLHWVFVAARRLSLVAASGATLRCGTRASHCSGSSCCRARALGTRASVVVVYGLSSCGSRALERRLSSCGARA